MSWQLTTSCSTHSFSQLVTIVDPHIKRTQDLYVYKEAVERNVLCKLPDGSEYEGWCWTGSSSWVDYFDPRSWDWWAGLFKFDKYKESTVNVHNWLGPSFITLIITLLSLRLTFVEIFHCLLDMNEASLRFNVLIFFFFSIKESLFSLSKLTQPSVFNAPEITMPRDNVHYGGWEHRDLHNLNGMATVSRLISPRTPNQTT
jgi:alpha 1,3-glucosidase